MWVASTGSTPTGTAPIEATATQLTTRWWGRDLVAALDAERPQAQTSASKPLPTPAQWAAPPGRRTPLECLELLAEQEAALPITAR